MTGRLKQVLFGGGIPVGGGRVKGDGEGGMNMFEVLYTHI
jgi:hypothetical protein